MEPLSDAQYVVIGGGAVGCAVAYSLALAGEKEIVVVEKEATIAAATTSQAAGLVGQVRSSVERVKLAQWSVETFSRMEQDPAARPGWRQVGSLRVALTDERVAEFRRLKSVAEEVGLEVQFISAAAAAEKWPRLSFALAKAVLWCESDGYVQPSDLAAAYRVRARKLGVRFLTGTTVVNIAVQNGRVTGVVTDRGTIACRIAINAAGAHAYQVARTVGLELPIVPIRHEFFVTVNAPGLSPALPVVRIPDAGLYLRAEIGSLLVGGWEPNSLATDPRRFAIDGGSPPLEPDWEVLAGFATQLAPHCPEVTQLGIRSVFKGWPTFTPDGRFIIGESCRVRGFVMAGGCNAHGVSGSAGIGRHVVESILEKDPSPYVKSLSPDRFTETRWDWDTIWQQAQRVYETYYGVGS